MKMNIYKSSKFNAQKSLMHFYKHRLFLLEDYLNAQTSNAQKDSPNKQVLDIEEKFNEQKSIVDEENFDREYDEFYFYTDDIDD